MFPKLSRTSRQGVRLGSKQSAAQLRQQYAGPGPKGSGVHLPHVAYGEESAARFYVDIDNTKPDYVSTKMLSEKGRPDLMRQRLGRRTKKRSKSHLGFTV